jgi:sugar lactone lactonase YvrE
MRGYWRTVAAASALVFCGTLNAAQAQAPSTTPFSPHVSAMDSKGNVYVGEIGGNPRVQRFVPTSATN